MTSGWFVFAVVGCIVVFTGGILAVVILKAAWAQREREALTSSDLRALEESALYLIDQLKSESDIAVGELEARSGQLKELIARADERINKLRELEAAYNRLAPGQQVVAVSDAVRIQDQDPKKQRVMELASAGMDCSEIARRSGVDCAEVKLMLRLSGARSS